jgi:hypothetical protein
VETCSNCGATLSADIDWCGQCYTHVPRARANTTIVMPDLERRRSLLAERILLTALLVAFGTLAYLALVPVVDDVGSTIWGTVASFLGVYTALGLVALGVSWRPAPTARGGRRAEYEAMTAETVVRVPDVAEGAPQA